jgi:ABC-type uncharacterized transport system auxiliary subunit
MAKVKVIIKMTDDSNNELASAEQEFDVNNPIDKEFASPLVAKMVQAAAKVVGVHIPTVKPQKF